MKPKINIIFLLVLLTCVLGACKNEPILNPNAPTMDEIIKNPTVNELNNLVVGTESGMRKGLEDYTDITGVFGREIYRFGSSEPRYTQEMLGIGTSQLDNTSFYVNNPWLNRYNVVRNAYLLIEGTQNSTYITNEKQKKGYYGFAKTVIAHQLLMNLNLTYSNGIRTDVKDYLKLGPIVKEEQALTDIAAMLKEAREDLADAEFLFELSNGFKDFRDIAGFVKFNYALAARVAVYRQQWAEALTDLQGSFLDLNGDLNNGAYHVFSSGAHDITNPSFYERNESGDIRIAHPSYTADITPGDDRIEKAPLRDEPATKDELTSDRDFWVYQSETAPAPIIRNEELILIYAEAKIQTNKLPDAVTALTRIRVAHNVGPYAGAVTQPALIDEMLKQRRFSLYGEGHRWVDLRRYNRLNTLPIDRPGDDVWPQLPLPLSEGGQ
jgi:hypothetical protein